LLHSTQTKRDRSNKKRDHTDKEEEEDDDDDDETRKKKRQDKKARPWQLDRFIFWQSKYITMLNANQF